MSGVALKVVQIIVDAIEEDNDGPFSAFNQTNVQKAIGYINQYAAVADLAPVTCPTTAGAGRKILPACYDIIKAYNNAGAEIHANAFILILCDTSGSRMDQVRDFKQIKLNVNADAQAQQAAVDFDGSVVSFINKPEFVKAEMSQTGNTDFIVEEPYSSEAAERLVKLADL